MSKNTGQAEIHPRASEQSGPSEKLKRKEYDAKLEELHMELVKMQYWIKATGKKLVILFEGRDAAGKGGAIGSFRPWTCSRAKIGWNFPGPRTRCSSTPTSSQRRGTRWRPTT